MKHKQLFCFTYAGGTASFFDVIAKDLGTIDALGFEYSGHGTRHKEALYNDFDELADDAFQTLKTNYYGDEYALFGYSMGSITLVEVLKRIVESDMRLPTNLFIAAHEPQTKSELQGYSADEVDEWVKERTVKFGAVPAKLLDNKVFWRTYLPLYRSDYTIISKYNFDKLNMHVNIPTTVFYSESDTPIKDMKSWEKYFPCEFYRYDGTHFFIQQHHEEMGMVIRKKMGVS